MSEDFKLNLIDLLQSLQIDKVRKLSRSEYADVLLNKFWIKVNKNSSIFGDDGKYPTECWVWIGGKYKNGYGDFTINNGRFKAHRISWIMYFGLIPYKKYILHKCDNRACINPEHLFIGTYQDNLKDMIAKGRGKCQIPRGILHPKCKLTEVQVLEIRERCKNGEMQKDLAVEFKVHRTLISEIILRKSWKHI